MAMDRSRRVAEVWNWLPAFRVVAEYESIHKASAVLRLSASSLSRTIKLLEDAVGEPLFIRTTTGLALTPFGATLLEGARDALRRVDDAIAASVSAQRIAKSVVAAASDAVLSEVLARAVGTLLGETSFRLIDVDEALVVGELLRGGIDAALAPACDPDTANAVLGERLGEVTLCVHAREGARTGEVVVPAGVRDAGEARIVATAPSLGAVARIAEAAGMGAVFPVGLAPAGFRVVAPPVGVIAVYGLRRRPVGATDVARDVLEAARATLAAPPRP
jgi:DNA-binding transcriptional LysR family regulator